MLGWFKKKFGKKASDIPPDELREEQAAAVEEAVSAPEQIVLPDPEGPSGDAAGQESSPLLADVPVAAVADEAGTEEEADGDIPPAEEFSADPSHEEALLGVVPESADQAEAPSVPADFFEERELSEPEAEIVPVEDAPPTAAERVEIPAEDDSVEETEVAVLPSADTEQAVEVLQETEASIEADRADAQPMAEELDPEGKRSPHFSQEKPQAKSMFRRLQDRLSKTRDSFVYRLDRLFLGKKEIDQELFDQLEEILITADLGVRTTLELLDSARKKVKRDQLSDPQALKTIIRDQLLAYIQASDQAAELVMPADGPFVIMVVGVNGVGKTTTIGKIAAKFVRSGQTVLLVAGDTFRAAAIGQLKIWGERVGVEVVAKKPGADPSSVVFDGLEYGVAHQYDVILIDTAGRLHTSVNLMEELKKIRRVMGKKLPGAPHEVMLVLDATTGQNAISQVKLFHEAVAVTGLTLTKLDGTAKGGIVANICRETGIPVRFIGIGEQLDDLRDFDAREFVDALFARNGA